MARTIFFYNLLALPSALGLDNGLGLTPPMGWRSWNLYGLDVNQSMIMKIMDGMVSRERAVDGVPTSLCDLGYCHVGLDDNWQLCGSYGDEGYTYHDADGKPVVNTERFPDMKAMTDYAHSLGLTAGWYGNNCVCKDHCGSGKQHNEDDSSCYKVSNQHAGSLPCIPHLDWICPPTLGCCSPQSRTLGWFRSYSILLLGRRGRAFCVWLRRREA